jgi:hypothetical protein
MLDAATIAADAADAIEAVADATLTWSPSWGGAALSAPVAHDAESVDALGVVSTGHQVHYATALLPGLAEGEVVTIGAESFRVAAVRAIGDGLTSIAMLHKFAAPA